MKRGKFVCTYVWSGLMLTLRLTLEVNYPRLRGIGLDELDGVILHHDVLTLSYTRRSKTCQRSVGRINGPAYPVDLLRTPTHPPRTCRTAAYFLRYPPHGADSEPCCFAPSSHSYGHGPDLSSRTDGSRSYLVPIVRQVRK